MAAADRANLALRAKNLKLLAERLRTHHDGDVPGDLREPLSFDGDGVLNLKLGADTLVSIHLASFATRDCRGRTQDGVPVPASDRTECASALHLVKQRPFRIFASKDSRLIVKGTVLSHRSASAWTRTCTGSRTGCGGTKRRRRRPSRHGAFQFTASNFPLQAADSYALVAD